MADISKITLPTGTSYDIKDATARADIANLKSVTTGAMHYIGVTTSALSDGATTNPIKINNADVTAVSGDVAIYSTREYVFSTSDNKWHEFGSTGSLKALAFKDNATGDFTPAGTVSKPTFSGTKATIKPKVTAAGSVTVTTNATTNKTATVSAASSGTATYTPAGSVSQPTFTGDDLTSTGKFTPAGSVTVTTNATTNKTATVSAASSGTTTYTPAGTVALSTGTGTANYTPAGTIAGTAVTLNTASIQVINSVGELPSCTLPSFTATVSNETLSLGWTAGTFSAGSLPTKKSAQTVATGVKSVTQGTFTGTGVELKAAFTGTGARLVTGNIAVPNTYTASFTGTQGDVSVTGTPSGTVSKPTFTGTGARLVTGNIAVPNTYTATFTGTEVEGSVDYTPAGSVSQPTFTGTKGTVTVS